MRRNPTLVRSCNVDRLSCSCQQIVGSSSNPTLVVALSSEQTSGLLDVLVADGILFSPGSFRGEDLIQLTVLRPFSSPLPSICRILQAPPHQPRTVSATIVPS